jgi:RNA polymerase sigma-70 factor (ECF subfamily)
MSKGRDNKISPPEQWVDLHGEYLSRYAAGKVRNRQAAEDLVQETFIAALKASSNFSGRSSERSWFVGILKHKIVDFFRKDSRERSVADLEAINFRTPSSTDNSWRWLQGHSATLERPEGAAEEKDFYSVLVQCLSQLPETLSKAFVLREIEGLETQEVCKILGISSTNLWVRLHRARAMLRTQLKMKWVGV